MSFTYDLSVLGDITDAKYDLVRARLALGDTVLKYKHLEDEEIEYHLEHNADSFEGALADCADNIAMRYAHEASFSVGDHRKELDARADRWSKLAELFRGRAGTSTGGTPEPMVAALDWYFYPGMQSYLNREDDFARVLER